MNTSFSQKIALFGGSFNPIHKGHLFLAEYILNDLELDRIIFIPTYVSPDKTEDPFLSTTHRLKMIEETIEDYPYFSCSDIETKKNTISYTFLTIDYFKEIYPLANLYFIIGEDNLAFLGEWHQISRLLKKVTFIIYPREKYSLSHKSLQLIKTHPNAFLFLNDAPRIEISSRIIREGIRTQKNIQALLHPKTYDYIIYHKIYRN